MQYGLLFAVACTSVMLAVPCDKNLLGTFVSGAHICRQRSLVWAIAKLLALRLFTAYCICCVHRVICVFLQYFDAVGWVFWPVKTVARITYTVLVETLNPAQSITAWSLESSDVFLHNQVWMLSPLSLAIKLLTPTVAIRVQL